MPCGKSNTLLCVLAFIAAILTVNTSAVGQTYIALYNFTGGSDGSGPLVPMAFDSLGSLYGATYVGGVSSPQGGNGVVFELSPAGSGQWMETVLYSFLGGPDGYQPSGLIRDSAGNLYGTTEFGGANGFGTVYELSPGADGIWAHTVLYSFQGGHNGGSPLGLVLDAAGNLYGITLSGGVKNFGTAFELSPAAGGSWNETVIQSLPYPPGGALAIDHNGNLYGTTLSGGAADQGTVFELTDTSGGWRLRTLYSFQGGDDGFNPGAGVVWTSNGHLYGVTQQGGSFGNGTFYELTADAGGAWGKTFTYSFGAKSGDPAFPSSMPVAQGMTSFWGASTQGGSSACGGIFNFLLGSSGWQERNVYESDCINSPVSVGAINSAGDLFGPGAGGIYGAGIVYELIR
jgi:uncharacterized repeat protein (TIGR03803 family)